MTESSTKKSSKGRGKVILECNRHNSYRNTRGKKMDTSSMNVTKRCGCPFQVLGRELRTDVWKLEVNCGTHNRDIGDTVHRHSYKGRMLQSSKDMVREYTAA